MTTATAEAAWSGAFHHAWRDLQPFPGRFDLAWRVALLCALVTATAMILRIPEAAISCYLIIFLMKEDAVQNCILAAGLILLATVIVVIMIPIVNLGIDSPAIRLAVMFFASFIFLWLSSTTPLGEQAAIVGLIIAFVMTLVTDVPVGQIGNQGLLMAWKMAAMPMFLMILFNLVFGIPAQTHVRAKIVERLRAAADHVRDPTGTRLAALLSEGNDLQLQRMKSVRLFHLVPTVTSDWLNGAVESSYRVLAAAAALPPDMPDEHRAALGDRLRAVADRIAGGEIPSGPETDDASRTAVDEALQALSRPDGGGDPRPRKQPPLARDAFSNPEHTRFALKTSIAAVLCYLIYTGLQWDGIHTAMITCYVAALGTLGETVRKLTLRIIGCLAGAAMGAFTLVFIMPHLTSIGGLMLLVFAGVLIGAWISSGNERISYAGVQVALAFLLTTVYGFGPNYEFTQASDRIAGILLGIVVIYVIFTQFWPRSVVGDIRDLVGEAIEALDRMGQIPASEITARTAAMSEAQEALGRAEGLLDMAPFEPRRNRAPAEDLSALGGLIAELRQVSLRLFPVSGDTGPDRQRLDSLRMGLTR